MRVWIITAISCQSCGGEIVTCCLDHKPTESESKEVVDLCGGMYCINTHVTECIMNKIVDNEEVEL